MRYSNVIFDFDGTICDTGEGIMKSAAYALEAYGFKVPDDFQELRCFIGPPLLVTFQEKFNADIQAAQKLVQKYRERYNDAIIKESKLYDGIEDLLKSLKKDNIRIAIASSKPTHYIEELLEHFKIRDYFDCVCGVSFKTDCESKASIIGRCMKELGADASDTLMVGDKNYDVNGANENHIDCAGVLWGYGSKFEFIETGAKFMAEKISDIEAIALGFFEQTEEYGGIFNGRIITVHCDTVTMVDGKTEKREIVDHPGGVAVAGLTENDEIVLVRQFRYPYKEIIYEIPAGKLEKGEDPAKAGLREFKEECGATPENYFSLGEIYPTPGYCSEIIRLFGATGLTFGEQHLDESEYLDVVRMPINEAVDKIMSGEIKDAKTIVAIFKLKELKK